jgi:hypothetical protein
LGRVPNTSSCVHPPARQPAIVLFFFQRKMQPSSSNQQGFIN